MATILPSELAENSWSVAGEWFSIVLRVHRDVSTTKREALVEHLNVEFARHRATMPPETTRLQQYSSFMLSKVRKYRYSFWPIIRVELFK